MQIGTQLHTMGKVQSEAFIVASYNLIYRYFSPKLPSNIIIHFITYSYCMIKLFVLLLIVISAAGDYWVDVLLLL